jgi:hypothetical protein
LSDVTVEMSDYDRHAWDRIELWKQSKLAESQSKVPAPIRKAIGKGKEFAGAGWEHVPKHAEIERALFAAVEGLYGMVADTAAQSVSQSKVLSAYRDAHLTANDLDDIQKLDLRDVDKVTPRLGYRYALTLAGEGAVAGAAAGGGTVAAAAGGVAGAGAGAVPGVAVTVGLLTADITVLLLGSTRVVAHHAVYHGYDPKEPGERAFMLGVMSASLMRGQAAKTAAFADLHKLVGLLARNATWETLGRDPFVRLSRRMFGKLGERMTKKKLGMALPVAGAVIGGGLNYRYVRDVADHAYWLYRERFLMDKYGFSDVAPPTVDVIDLQVLAEDEDPDAPPSPGSGDE